MNFVLLSASYRYHLSILPSTLSCIDYSRRETVGNLRDVLFVRNYLHFHLIFTAEYYPLLAYRYG